MVDPCPATGPTGKASFQPVEVVVVPHGGEARRNTAGVLKDLCETVCHAATTWPSSHSITGDRRNSGVIYRRSRLCLVTFRAWHAVLAGTCGSSLLLSLAGVIMWCDAYRTREYTCPLLHVCLGSFCMDRRLLVSNFFTSWRLRRSAAPSCMSACNQPSLVLCNIVHANFTQIVMRHAFEMAETCAMCTGCMPCAI